MKKLLLSFVVLFLIVGLSKSNGQTPSPTVTSLVGATIASIAELSVTAGNENGAAFAFTTAAELTAGKEITNVFTLTAKANKPYYVNVKAAAANFGGGVVGQELPVSKLAVSIGAGEYITLSATDQPIIGASDAKIAKGSNDYVVNYKMTPGVTAAPAVNYATTLTYTITAP